MLSEGILWTLNFRTLFRIIGGPVLGIIIGAIPGLTVTMGVALFLPVTVAMSPVDGLSLLMGLYIGGTSGGLIPSILLNIPGTPASVASATSASEVSGVSSAGLQTTVQPAARAGAILRAIMAAGKFQGAIAAMAPTGAHTANMPRPPRRGGTTPP